jgi:hypothetical protein
VPWLTAEAPTSWRVVQPRAWSTPSSRSRSWVDIDAAASSVMTATAPSSTCMAVMRVRTRPMTSSLTAEGNTGRREMSAGSAGSGAASVGAISGFTSEAPRPTIATAMVTARATLSTVTTARPRRVAMSLRPSASVAHDEERMARVAARERRTRPLPPRATTARLRRPARRPPMALTRMLTATATTPTPTTSASDRLGDTDPKTVAADSATRGATTRATRAPATTPATASRTCSAAISDATRAGVAPATCSRVSSLASLTSREPSRVTISSTAATSISTAKNSMTCANVSTLVGKALSRMSAVVLAHHPAAVHTPAGTGPSWLRRATTASACDGSRRRSPIDHRGVPTGSIASNSADPAKMVPGSRSG